MKRTVLVFGLIAGVILSAFIVICVPGMKNLDADSLSLGMFIGYTVQLLTFSLIFFAIKQYRDKYNGGVISFGKAFRIGLWISLIGSAFYVITWAIVYHTMLPDFMDIWGAAELQAATKRGDTAAEIASLKQQIADGKELYSTWWGFAGFTLFEILPTGLIVSLICALILKRKQKKQVQMA
jgi:hypothetical protein